MKKKFSIKLFLFFLSLYPYHGGAAENPKELLEKADDAFRNARFEEAKNLYEKIPEDSYKNSSAYAYNYGTVLMKAGEEGKAYAYLLKSLALNPLDNDTRNNLEFVRNQLGAGAKNITPPGLGLPEESLFLPQGLWLSLALAVLLLFLLLYGKKRKFQAPHFFCLFLAFVFSCICFLYQWQGGHPLAVITNKTCELRSGPSHSFPLIMSLESGSLVNIKEDRDSWYKINFLLKNDHSREIVGWIEAKSLLKVSN